MLKFWKVKDQREIKKEINDINFENELRKKHGSNMVENGAAYQNEMRVDWSHYAKVVKARAAAQMGVK